MAEPTERTTPRRIKTLGSREVYSNPWMSVREDEIVRAGEGGEPVPGIYAVVDKPHSAVIVPWDGQRIHLVGQHRYPLNDWSWEFPQGALHDGENHDPAHIARQELLEETGITAGKLDHIGELAFAPGMTSQRYSAFIASDLSFGEPEPDPEEVGLIAQFAVTEAEFESMISSGEVVDSATIAVWHLAVRRGLPG